MSKYRGKYKKCRQCKHVEEVANGGCWVTDNCPKGFKFSHGGNYIQKSACETCENFENKDGDSNE